MPAPPNPTCPNCQVRREPAVWSTPPEPPNEQVRHIPLTKGPYAIVGAADCKWLSRCKWTAPVFGGKVWAIPRVCSLD